MDETTNKLIQDSYGFSISSVIDAPRQFVAETYILTVDDGSKYFCKIVSKPLFIPHIIESLPVLDQLHISGIDRLNYPIKTKTGALYLLDQGILVVLFSYIDAPQNYDYDMYTFGKLLAQVHSVSVGSETAIPTESFTFKYPGDRFGVEIKNIHSLSDSDPINKRLKDLIKKYGKEMEQDFSNYINLGSELKSENSGMVITHGDPGGNVLAKSATDLYLIDWDDILLALPERDTWFFQDKPEFMHGYQTVFQNYQVNKKLANYYTYKRYFEDLIEYFAEINGDFTEEHRLKNLNGLINDCLEGWLRPLIRRFDQTS